MHYPFWLPDLSKYPLERPSTCGPYDRPLLDYMLVLVLVHENVEHARKGNALYTFDRMMKISSIRFIHSPSRSTFSDEGFEKEKFSGR